MKTFNYLSEFYLNIEDVSISLICDNPPDEISVPYRTRGYNMTSLRHIHPYYEMMIASRGHSVIEFENASIKLEENSSVIIPPLVYHRTTPSENSLILGINFNIKSNKLNSSFPLYNSVVKNLTYPFRYINDFKTTEILIQLNEAIESGDYPQMSMLFHQFMLRLENSSVVKTDDAIKSQSDSNLRRMYKIQQTISRFYKDDINLESIADSLFLSTRQVNRIIKQNFGCTFKEYLTQIRMNSSAELLKNTDLPIGEICQQVGYNSPQAFYTAFQKHFSITPAEYRKNQKTNP